MPGLSPEDISITIMDDAVMLHGEKHGAMDTEPDMILDEWAIGPYERTVALPPRMRGNLANATYGNGVLVVSIPTTEAQDEAQRTSFQLRPIASTRGERIVTLVRMHNQPRPTST